MKKSISLLSCSFKFSTLRPFHLAIPVNSIANSMKFYGQIMSLPQGRKCKYNKWVDYSFFGHQLVCHYVSDSFKPQQHCNDVDKQDVPIPHFGLVLQVKEWMQLKNKLLKNGVKFIIEPQLRFQGQKGEQHIMFFKDPTGNSIQIKAMTNPDNLFAKYEIKIPKCDINHTIYFDFFLSKVILFFLNRQENFLIFLVDGLNYDELFSSSFMFVVAEPCAELFTILKTIGDSIKLESGAKFLFKLSSLSKLSF